MSFAFFECGQEEGSSQLPFAVSGFVVQRALLHLWISGGDACQAAQGLLLFLFFLLVSMVIFLGIFSSKICRFCNNYSVPTQMLFWKNCFML